MNMFNIKFIEKHIYDYVICTNVDYTEELWNLVAQYLDVNIKFFDTFSRNGGSFDSYVIFYIQKTEGKDLIRYHLYDIKNKKELEYYKEKGNFITIDGLF
jgi:hypothetical protein